MPLTGAKDVNWHEAGPKEGPNGMRRGPRSGRSPDASNRSHRSIYKWEDALGHLSEAKK